MPVFQSRVAGVLRQTVGGNSIYIFPSTINIQILAKAFLLTNLFPLLRRYDPAIKT